MINETQQLSERERQILYLVASGRSNQQIANELGISINTVKVHLRNVFGKIGAASRTEASMYAVRTGIVTVDRAVAGPSPVGESEALPLPVAEELVAEPEPDTTAPLPDDNGASAPEVGALPQTAETPPPFQDRAEPQPAVVTPAVAPRDTAVNTPRGRRSKAMLALLAICLLVLTLGGVAVAWLVRAGDAGDAQTQEAARFNQARWKELAALPTARAGFALAAVGEQLFVIAGENERGVLNTVERYEPRSGDWQERAQKPTPVTDVRAVTIGQKLYIPGGRRSADPKDIVAAFERYDPRTNRWEKLADLPQPRSGYGLAALEGKLYLFGGWDGTSYRDEVFAYDPSGNAWSELEAMPTARAFADAAVVEGSIFVLGGENKAGPVANNEQYLPAQEDTQPWVNRPPLPRPRSRFSTAVALGNIYVFGGDAAADALQYDARTERWQSFEAPAIIGSQPGATLFDETIMILGGKLGPGAFSTTMYSYQALFRTLLPGS